VDAGFDGGGVAIVGINSADDLRGFAREAGDGAQARRLMALECAQG
jgi:hypothetical protein